MTVNNTLETPCVPGNGTDECTDNSPSTGLAVGLTLFFLLLVIIAGVLVYKYRSKIRNMVQFEQTRSQKKEDYSDTTHTGAHQYTNMIREQPIAQTPIYENVTTQAPTYNRTAANQSSSPSEPEEDLYLQCDVSDDAIYSNDPKCHLATLSHSQEEDVYIMPDS